MTVRPAMVRVVALTARARARSMVRSASRVAALVTAPVAKARAVSDRRNNYTIVIYYQKIQEVLTPSLRGHFL
jgi:hypothetical protein